MALLWVEQIKAGRRTFQQVPRLLKEKVMALLQQLPNEPEEGDA